MAVKTETLLKRREENNEDLRDRDGLSVFAFLEVHSLPSCQVLIARVVGEGSSKQVELVCFTCGVTSKLESVSRTNLAILF